MKIACLPWYEMPETKDAQDALWRLVAERLRQAGMSDAPARLSHDPPIPAVLSDPDLLVGQCCGYDVAYGFHTSVTPIATPHYRAPGCEGTLYRSFVLVREDDPATDLADLAGRRCAINGFNSHSGTNALRALVAPLARDGRFFAEVRVSGAHVESLAMMLAGGR